MSPSSSDNEGDKHNALLRVQRRRQSSRRLSQIAFDGGPMFRPLDVLICEDHPVSRMVMEKLLEKLRCRTISVANGSEAVRYAMSEIKFDIIFLEYRLPQINGADVARMIRETKNTNSHTPIVAITAYLKELQAPHYFDSLIEKPISSSKLTEVLKNLCQWKPESPGINYSMSLGHAHPVPSGLRQASSRADDSPTSSSSMYAGRPGSSVITSSREDSISSSLFGDSESVSTDDVPVVISRKATGDWDEGGLGISQDEIVHPTNSPKSLPHLVTQQSAPGQLEHPGAPQHSVEKLKARKEHIEKRLAEGTDSADDEDEELGLGRDKLFRGKPLLPSSKLGIEMMRADSHDSVTVGSESTPEPITQVVTPSKEMDMPSYETLQDAATRTPPDSGVSSEDKTLVPDVDETPRPQPTNREDALDEEPTPRPLERSGLLGDQ
ncbi:LOW QUALITY PROTEIN: response regulator receiver RIM15p [Colletotrichum tofieldiae]|nr:LOW QUALITY PROTEIN: response regulator receiver RIM15p [Colletotrichum tofieldiae]